MRRPAWSAAGTDEDPVVRPFVLTGGRTVPSRSDLDLTTQVVVAAGAESAAPALDIPAPIIAMLRKDLRNKPIATLMKHLCSCERNSFG